MSPAPSRGACWRSRRRATNLSQAVYLSPGTIVGIVDRLEEKGLVARQRNRKDRRQVLIGITGAGETLVESAPSLQQGILAEMLKNLPELEQVSVTLALEKVVDLMEARKIEASPVLQTGPISTPPPKKANILVNKHLLLTSDPCENQRTAAGPNAELQD